MKSSGCFVRKHFGLAISALLVAAVGITPAFAQQGIVSDWSNHHIKFTSPGSEMDALMNGHRQEWQNFVNGPRYRAQQAKRSAAQASRSANTGSAFSDWRDSRRDPSRGGDNSSLEGLWTSKLAGVGAGTSQGVFPAEYDANFSSPSCTGDYIAFPVSAAGSTTQANLVVYNHLYVNAAGTGFCSGATTPTTYAAYYVYPETGGQIYLVQGSPVVSESGTQIAFVVNDTTNKYVRLYVVTLGPGGTDGAPTELTDAGTYGGAVGASGSGTANGATYRVLLLATADQGLTSPWVDYTHNVAYVASTGGKIYKINNVFGTTAPSLAATPWPVTVITGEALTAPVVDPTTGDIFVGAANGDVYCRTSAAGAACGTGAEGSFAVAAIGHTGGTAGAVIDSPVVVDNGNTTGTTGWVFAQATNTTATATDGTTGTRGTATADAYAVLAQAPISSTGMGTAVGEDMGTIAVSATYTTTGVHEPAITLTTSNLYSGDFDNEYYNSSGSSYSGHLYFCGYTNATDTNGYPPGATAVTYNSIPQLWRIGFTSGGALTGTPTAVEALASNTTTEASGCTPLTEFFNANANSGAGEDYLFTGVSGYGSPTGCETAGTHDGCVMSFTLPTTATGLAVGATPTATYSLTGNGDGSSGIVIDNQSTDTGASQVYFSNLQTGNATAASQAALQ